MERTSITSSRMIFVRQVLVNFYGFQNFSIFLMIFDFSNFLLNFRSFQIFSFLQIIFCGHPFVHTGYDYSLYQYRQYQQLLDHMPHHQWRYRNDSLMAILSHLCNLYRLSNHYQIEVCQMDCYLDQAEIDFQILRSRFDSQRSQYFF